MDGAQVVTASDKNVRVWDAKTGQALTNPLRHGWRVLSAHFSPDGKRVLTTSIDSNNWVWDALTEQARAKPFSAPNGIRPSRFSIDGTRVVTTSDDNTARVWDAHTGKAITEPLPHESEVRSIQFSPDGTRLVTTSAKTVHLWDAKTGQALIEPLGHEGEVSSALFSPDGRRVIIISEDKVLIWDVPTLSKGDTELVASLAEAVGGYRLSEQGLLVTVSDSVSRLAQLRERTSTATLADGIGPWFVRWFLENRWNRTISPLSSVSVPEYIQGLIAEGRIEDAAILFPGHTLLTKTVRVEPRPLQTQSETNQTPAKSTSFATQPLQPTASASTGSMRPANITDRAPEPNASPVSSPEPEQKTSSPTYAPPVSTLAQLPKAGSPLAGENVAGAQSEPPMADKASQAPDNVHSEIKPDTNTAVQ